MKSRESNTVEFKESFNKNSTAKYAKTMAAYSNNRGGYIIFGVKDNPRTIVGLKNDNFENMSQEQFSEAINSLFAPAMDWDCGTLVIEVPATDGTGTMQFLKIGWIYTAEAEYKPVIAQKPNDGEKINSGDVYYRYRARSEKIKFAEMSRLIEERTAKEREGLLRLFEVIRDNKTANFELLKQMLSPDVVDGDEAYEFTWVGKKAAIVEANKPIRKTLRPCVAESKDWDTTENLYIEGDNLEVLKLLQESYLGKVKMIYIDPPYNTGNDFIYADDFKMESEEWKVESGEWSEEGDRLFKNTDSNGRFHSDWCSMIYSRLMLARNLLTEDGVIFISIDDNEMETLTNICNEIFGEQNAVTPFIWPLPRGINAGLKECSETLYWLELLTETDYLSEQEFKSLNADCDELRRMLSATTKTISSAQQK